MKTFIAVIVLVGAVLITGYLDKPQEGYFAQVPEDQIHTMRVYEDGSFNIEYIDGTSEEGCTPSGLCND